MKNVKTYTMNILIIAGPSGQGKSYFEQNIKNKDVVNDYNEVVEFKKIIQTTTRKIRENESSDPTKSYQFISIPRYKELDNDNKLFGRTHIDYTDRTDYYGSKFPSGIINRDISKLECGKDVTKKVFTVILNDGGIQDFFKWKELMESKPYEFLIDLNNKESLEKVDLKINPIMIYIDGNSDVKRKGRDTSYVDNERKSLQKYMLKEFDKYSFKDIDRERRCNCYKENYYLAREDKFKYIIFNDFQNHILLNEENINYLLKDISNNIV